MASRLATIASVAVLSAVSAPALAAPIKDLVVQNLTGSTLLDANAFADTYFASRGLTNVAVETFESRSFVAGDTQPFFDTNVGRFTAGTAGQYTVGLGITPSIFSGRYNVTLPGSNWLDSYDYKTVTWAATDVDPLGGATGQAFDYVGFFMTDVGDVKAKLTLSGTTTGPFTIEFPFTTSGTTIGNGRLYFVGFGVHSSYTLLNMEFSQDVRNDGWGIDNIRLAKSVPEPATLGLLGLGLLAVGATRRRKA